MSTAFHLNVQNRSLQLTEAQLSARLHQLAELKTGQSVQPDLSPVDPWRLVPNFFQGINLSASKNFLEGIQQQVIDDPRLFALFKQAAARFNAMYPSYAVTIQQPPLPNLRTLVESCDARWNGVEERYEGIHFNRERFVRRMHACGNMFDPKINTQQNHGFIEKKEIPKGSKVYVRADLHGDLKSLIEHLKSLQQEGLLDENFRCRENVYLVFCGDYMDRGEHSLPVAEFLAALKMENPDQVYLIRGNHEDVQINSMFRGAEQNYIEFLKDGENCRALNHFYETMPLTLYMAEEGGEYIQFTHGLFELHVDPSKMLDSEEESRMVISKTNDAISERIQTLADDQSETFLQKIYYLREYTLIDYACSFIGFLTPNVIQSWIFTPLYNLFVKYVAAPPPQYKLKTAARRIMHLKKQENGVRRGDLTIYNWGDIKGRTSIGNPGRRRWMLCAQDVKHALRIMGDKRKVKLLFRGHQHLFEHAMHNGKVVATTLPVGMDSYGYKKHFAGQLDRAYILTPDAQVKGWKKQAFLRPTGKSSVELTTAESIFSDKI